MRELITSYLKETMFAVVAGAVFTMGFTVTLVAVAPKISPLLNLFVGAVMGNVVCVATYQLLLFAKIKRWFK